MKKNAMYLIGLIFTALIVFGVFHNAANTRHHVEFFAGSNFQGYENFGPSAKIDASPAIAWKQTSNFPKAMGWIMLAVMVWGMWYVGTDRYLGGSKKKGDGVFLGYLFTAGPMVLSFLFFFIAYSSGSTSNSVGVERERFNDWLQTGAIEKRGEKTYVDAANSDTLKTLFINRKWIK